MMQMLKRRMRGVIIQGGLCLCVSVQFCALEMNPVSHMLFYGLNYFFIYIYKYNFIILSYLYIYIYVYM